MEKSKKLNLGISILRVWMAFEVILLHRMSWRGYEGLLFDFLKACELFSVPVFMIIAFYLSEKTLEESGPSKIKQRFIRLFIPQAGWAMICWTVYVLTDVIFMHKLSHGLNDLLIAIISGCREGTNPSTWFQCVLILLTFFYYVIFRYLDHKKAWIAVYVSLFMALLIQFNGAYYDFFQNQSYEVVNTIGRIFEVMPFASIGLILKHLEVEKKLKDKRMIMILAFIFLFVLGFYLPFPRTERGFFEGLYPLYMGTVLFLVFVLLPLERIQDKSRQFIIQATRFTLGIYCAHRLLYSILEIVYELLGMAPKSFTKCLITYLVCYLMSFIMSIFPGNIFRKMVD